MPKFTPAQRRRFCSLAADVDRTSQADRQFFKENPSRRQMDSDELIRIYTLPFGFKARFRWHDQRLGIEWSPHLPRIEKPRARRKFVAAYQDARRDFYTDIAATIGGNILIVDTDLKTIDGLEVIAAPVKH